MLVALNIIAMDPKGLGGADNAGLCLCGDSFNYALKDDSGHPFTPHSEWLCTRLAHEVGIAVPDCAYIENGAGGYYFGSRFAGEIQRTKDAWIKKVRSGEMSLAVITPVISRIFAFDLFVHNDDRHWENYVPSRTANGWGLHAIDFSRAWMFNGFPPPALPMRAGDNTIDWHRRLAATIGYSFDPVAATDMLDRLAAIKIATIRRIIGEHPDGWLPEPERASVLSWWKSSERNERIKGIRKGIANGAYL